MIRSRPITRHLALGLAALLAALLAVLTAACGNPNEHIEADQFFRPEPKAAVAPTDAQSEPAGTESDVLEQSQQAEQLQQSEGADLQQDQQAADAAAAQADDPAAPAPVVRSDDLLRRYINPSYGYSLELICPPFCDPTSNGIDRAAFLADSGRALIDVIVSNTVPLEDFDALWRETFGVPDFVETPARRGALLPLVDVEGWRYAWEEDRRAMGGFLVRWDAVIISIDGLLYIVRGGAVQDEFESVELALQQAFDSFIAPLEAQAAPGRYARFDFLFDYGTDFIAQEFGVPAGNPPIFDAGVIVLQRGASLEAVLVWETIGEAFFNADVAIERTLLATLGVEIQSDFRDADPTDGQPTRFALSQTQLGEGIVQIGSYSWYCPNSGREFTLHAIHGEDPESAARPLLDGFRCDAGSIP